MALVLAGCAGGDVASSDAAVPVIADAAVIRDAAVPDLGVARLDAAMDAGVPDAGDGGCPPPPVFNFKCDPHDSSTCPAGFCIVNQCVAGQFDPHRFDGSGDGVCGPCEDAAECPADCGAPPTTSGQKVYDDPNTITVWLHGYTNHTAASLQATTYGSIIGCGDVGDALTTYGPSVPCGRDPAGDTAPNQVVAVEYYGAQPPAWMSAQDIMEVEQYPYLGGPTGLQRYGLIVAKFIRWRMAHTGATHVNIACHSMGCLLTRYVIENDIEQLASENKIVRWVTGAGVIGGAQLARLHNNPAFQMAADQVGLAVDDFALMNPDYVQTYAASWDHQLHEGNNPLLAGMLIHHVGATDPRIGQAFNLQLLNLGNPDELPNDGILFTFDEMFASQAPRASLVTPSGEVLSATHAFIHVGHIDAPSAEGFHAALAAGLFHRRKVFVTLDSITLKKDHEFTLQTPLELGTPPAEVVAEVQVSYDPYTMPKFGTHTLVDDDELAYRSPQLLSQVQGTTLQPSMVLYAGPVFDDQMAIHLKLTLTETDWYARYGCTESGPALSDRNLLNYESDVSLMDQVIPWSDDGADVKLRVHVVDLY
jgi:hypothetical protein